MKKPWPPELPVIAICVECNTGFSLDEQYVVSILSAVISGTTELGTQVCASAARAMMNSPALKQTIERSKQEYETMGGDTRLIWTPDMERMSRVIVQDGIYRYSVMYDGGIQVRTVLYEYLATEVQWDF